MKTLFVGDTHGATEVIELALNTPYADRVVFMGDYLDSFNRPVQDQVFNLMAVLNACENNPERFIGLMGNHELSYLDAAMRCSGYNLDTQRHVIHLADRMKRILKPYFWVDENWLATHAGVSDDLLHAFRMTLQEYLEAGKFKQIGYARGGDQQVGGLHWCDFNKEFAPIKGVNQIVGHTHYDHDGFLRTLEGNRSINYNVDCIPHYNPKETIFLVLEDGIPKKVHFEDL